MKLSDWAYASSQDSYCTYTGRPVEGRREFHPSRSSGVCYFNRKNGRQTRSCVAKRGVSRRITSSGDSCFKSFPISLTYFRPTVLSSKPFNAIRGAMVRFPLFVSRCGPARNELLPTLCSRKGDYPLLDRLITLGYPPQNWEGTACICQGCSISKPHGVS